MADCFIIEQCNSYIELTLKYVKSIAKILGYLGKEIYLQHKLRL